MTKQPRRSAFTWCLIGVNAALIVLLAYRALPNNGRTTRRFNAIINNLRQIDGAKELFIAETHYAGTNEISTFEVNRYLKSPISAMSVVEETYTIGKAGEAPEAHLTRSISESGLPAGAGITLENLAIKLPNEPRMSIDDFFKRVESRRHRINTAAIVLAILGLAVFLTLWISRKRMVLSSLFQ